MTDDTEDVLRVLLAERAAVPALSGDPVATVQRRHRRRSALRVGAASAGAAIAVLAIVVAPRIVGRPFDRSVTAGRQPSASMAPSTAATPRATVGSSDSPDPKVRFLETDPEFRAATLTSDPAAEVRCAIDERDSVYDGADVRIATFVWAYCTVVSGETRSGVSLPVRLDYEGDRITGFLVPRDGADYAKDIRKQFTEEGARHPSAAVLARLEAEIAARAPASERAPVCPDPATARVVAIQLATMTELLERDLDRGLKRIYVVERYVGGLGEGPSESGSAEQGPMPDAVKACLTGKSVHGLPIVLVGSRDDPVIEREQADGFSRVLQGVVISLSKVPNGDHVEMSATADFGGGLDAHGGDFRVARSGAAWIATSTGRMWIS